MPRFIPPSPATPPPLASQPSSHVTIPPEEPLPPSIFLVVYISGSANIDVADFNVTRSSKRKPASTVNVLLTKALMNDLGKDQEKNVSEDRDELFCHSLVDSFKNLPRKKNKIAKIKVLQLLLELEEDDD